LYGVEPFSYYIKNLLLNFNVATLLGVAALPLVLVRWGVAATIRRRGNRKTAYYDEDNGVCRGGNIGTEIFLLSPMYIWMTILFPRPHKEERFLYPIYPMIAYGAAITVREGLSMVGSLSPSFDRWRQGGRRARRDLFVGLALLSFPAAISISRSLALYRYYSAPAAVYRELYYRASPSSTTVAAASRPITYVCTAGEWYRFPSSFFLPPNHQLGYLKSSFGGQLPQPFTVHGSRVESLDVPEAGHFNDRNEDEMDRYVDIDMCSYVIELSRPASTPLGDIIRGEDIPEGIRYMDSDNSGGSWELLVSRHFLDTALTPPLHRILYLPHFGRNGGVAFKGYNLYERRR
jgi:alpha-1,2-mannosyltransferase